MKRFIMKCTLFMFLIVPLCIRICYNTHHPEPNGYFFAQVDKQQYLQHTLQTDTQRIVFIGGSNLVFGLDSVLIEESLKNIFNMNVTVINTGLHVGIGLNRMLENILPYLRKGDILILIPEYGQFSKEIYGDINAWYVERDILRKPLLKMRKVGFLKLPVGLGNYLSEAIKHPARANPSESAYRRDAFNRNGDNTAHLTLPSKNVIDPFTDIKTYDSSCINAFLRYIKVIHDKEIQVLFSYPCCQEKTYYNNEHVIQETDTFLRKILPVIFIGKPERYILNDSFLYDTPYHLNAEGRKRRTSLVIEDLTSYFKIKEKE